MKSVRRHIIAFAIVLIALTAMPAVASAAPKGWEPAKSEYAGGKTIIKETEFEIKVMPGVIMVNANHPVQIKIFTILGRVVNSETLQPGASRFTLPAHGVYIVKIGDITCKVAV